MSRPDVAREPAFGAARRCVSGDTSVSWGGLTDGPHEAGTVGDGDGERRMTLGTDHAWMVRLGYPPSGVCLVRYSRQVSHTMKASKAVSSVSPRVSAKESR